MKRTTLYRLLGAETILCLILFGLQFQFPDFVPSVFAFPFQQIAQLLRIVSLSGPAGNTLALGLYCAVSVLPLLVLIKIRTQRVLQAEDILLPILSLLFFRILYLMINPGLSQLSQQKPPADFFGILLYSVLSGYLILRSVRRLSQAQVPLLQQYTKGLLIISLSMLVFAAFGFCFSDLLYSIRSVRQGNTAPGLMLNTTYLFLIFGYLIRIVPFVFMIFIGIVGLDLLDAMTEDPYSVKVAEAAEKISRIAQRSVILTVSLSIGFNLLQTIMADSLYSVNWTLQLPFTLILLSLCMLLFAQFLQKTRQIKQEHDLFI